MATKKTSFNLFKVVLNKATGKVEVGLGWYAVRTHASTAAKAAKLTDFSITNLSKAVKLGQVTEAQAKKLMSQVCNGGKGLPWRSYNKLVNDTNVKPAEKKLLKGSATVEPKAKPTSKKGTGNKKGKGNVDESVL